MKHELQNNKHIIHYNIDGKYMCNRKCKSFDFKLTTDEKKVTCHNCKVRINMNKTRKEKISSGDFEIKERYKHKTNLGPRIKNLEEKIQRIRKLLGIEIKNKNNDDK